MVEPDQPKTELDALYERVDRRAAELALRHTGRLQCRRGCFDCCVDDITVFEVEAERIGRHHGALLAQGRPHPVGACAFLDDGGSCRIYAHRPYVCRTQGLPLRWLEEGSDGHVVELRDICPLNDRGQPLESLDSESCWQIGPFEAELARLQAERDGGAMRRVRLRDLFVGGGNP